MTRARIPYIGPWMYPVYVGFTTDEKKYKSEFKRLSGGEPGEKQTFPVWAAALHLKTDKDENLVMILLNRETVKGLDQEQVYALLTHECTHAKQMVQRCIQEKEFSDEAEAYLVQYLAEWVFKQYKDGK